MMDEDPGDHHDPGKLEPFSMLPDEMLECIISFTSNYRDLRHVSWVSKRFNYCVKRLVRREGLDFVQGVKGMNLVWSQWDKPDSDSSTSSTSVPQEMSGLEITKRYSHNAVFDDHSMAMYVFGGCTSSSTTFNDLWKFDLTTRTWTKPLATGTYPSPKACSVLVLDEKQHRLLLFGGWTHPSLYPLHQTWRLFNELHQYDIEQKRWTHILPSSSVKPSSMAGHSATIHGNLMVIFGGLHKTSTIIHYSPSNQVWCFDMTSNTWHRKDISNPKPEPRYGQSQLYIDNEHLLILGGCGGPNNIITDIWLLIMKPPQWRWVQCTILNPEHGVNHMWCHPAVKVNQYAVILGKNRSSSKTKALGESDAIQFNVIPQMRKGVNRGMGSVRRRMHGEMAARQSPSSDMDTSPPSQAELSVEPVPDGDPVQAGKASTSQQQVYKTSVQLNINNPEPTPGPSSRPSYSAMSTRLQAFSNASPSIYTSNSFSANMSSTGAIPKASGHGANANDGNTNSRESLKSHFKAKLEDLKKKERDLLQREKALEARKEKRSSPTFLKPSCLCHRLTMHVLDLTNVVKCHTVEWLEVKSNVSYQAPEETILYTLVKGRAEIIMFGGIQKDVSTMTSRSQPITSNDSTSNSLHFLSFPSSIV